VGEPHGGEAATPAGAATVPKDAPADGDNGSAQRAFLLLLAVAMGAGLVGSFAAVLFELVVHGLTNLLWTNLPDAAGWTSPPWWYVLVLPTLAGLIGAGALRLPGHGGTPPLKGLGTVALPPAQLVSVLLAAIVALGCGIVLGPEAPLTAFGLTCGLVVARAAKLKPEQTQVVSLAGAFAAIAALFGGPLPSSLMFFEMSAAHGMVPSNRLGRLLVPGLVAAGTGALVFTGVAGWPGIKSFTFPPLPLPSYPTVRIVDLVWCLLVAAVVALVVVASRRVATNIVPVAARRQLAVLLAGGFLVGLLAVLFRALANEPVDLVLFSGENSMSTVVGVSSLGVLLLLLFAKGLAYSLSLGTGFRGGPIFPAVFLGIGVGVLAAQVLPGLDLTPAVITGMAAGTAAVLRLPFTGVVLAAIVGGANATEAIPMAILGAVIAWLVARRWDTPGPRDTLPGREQATRQP
jgi:H+/Cl- antiporter ClcA